MQELETTAANIHRGDGISWSNNHGRGSLASGVTTALHVSRDGDVVTVRTGFAEWSLNASDAVTLYRD